MLFSSAEFILAFLPLTLLAYFWLNGRRLVILGKGWLVLASLFFYGWWNIHYLPLILVSLLVNFAIGSTLAAAAGNAGGAGAGRRLAPRALLAAGILFNLALLGYYKYAGFLLANLGGLLDLPPPAAGPLLPLAISFFTFTQIAYLADSYRGETREYDLLNYALFVTFFPHLIAGPIVHHKEIMPQFAAVANLARRHRNILLGLILFSIGLAKKVLIADTLALWATAGFERATTLNFLEAWCTSLSYTLQLYFDFSGYTDMALGASLLFNIRLPINFNSPYRATSIRDFWRRWHITLSRFLRDYVYVPLGGSRRGRGRTYANLLATFALGGLWHGASWMFVLWGLLHGIAMAAHRLWRDAGLRMPPWLGWLLTFNFVNATWVFFRARTMDDALKVLRGMADPGSLMLPDRLAAPLAGLRAWGVEFGPWIGRLQEAVAHPLLTSAVLPAVLLLALVLALLPSNSTGRWLAAGAWRRATPVRAVAFGLLAALSLVWLLASPYSEFIYFNF